MADEATTQLSRMSLVRNDAIQSSAKPTLLDKRPAGKLGRPMELNTNITPITLAADITYFKYDIRMYAIFPKRDGSEGIKEFSKQTRDDYIEQERKTACTEIFMKLVEKEPVFKGDLIYDRAAILFSTKKLEGITGVDKRYRLPANAQSVSEEATSVEVTIKMADCEGVKGEDLAKCVNADFKQSHSKELMEVLNLATSQIPFFTPQEYMTYGNGNIYLLDAAKFGFVQADAPHIGGDKFTGIGLSKGVRILEGNNQPGGKDYMPALVLDVKKTAFHLFNQTLLDKIQAVYGTAMPNTAHLTRDLKDLRCCTTHKRGTIVVGSFTSGPVGKATFKDKNGEPLNICAYYETKYKIKIQRPDLPGVIDKHQRNIYPMELLRVAPNQRVKVATKDVVETLIKISAIKPEQRFQQTQRMSQLLQLDSERAARLGVSVPSGQQSLVVPARQLPPVGLLGGVGVMSGPSWRGAPKFVVGAKVEKWAAFLFYSSRAGKNPRFKPDETFTKFVQSIAAAGNRKGMSMAAPTLVDKYDIVGDVDPMIEQAVKKAAAADCTYVLIISDERIKSHDQLKFMELVYKLTTQEVTLTKAAQVAFENKAQTLENIIMKTNVKLRGMNHVVAKDNGLIHASDACFMGIFIQQPRGMTAAEIEGGAMPSYPAVIGLSANNGNLQLAPDAQREMAAQQYFTTAYKYAHPKEWKKGETQLQTLQGMIEQALQQFKDHRGWAPSKVVVYRGGGASEGQLPYIASAERDAFHAAFTALHVEYKPTLVMIAASKEHNERFYHKAFPRAEGGARVDTNLAPGVVVDKVAVNPELNEFYLQSHKALQGTAKATKYTLLHESSGKLSNDQIQHMTNALCHLHQIVNSTTAVPTPLYVAEESAKRAVNIYHHVRTGETYELDDLNMNLTSSGLGSRINA